MSVDEIRNTLLNSKEYNLKLLLSDLKDVSEIDIKTKDFLDEIYDITLRRDVDPQGLQYFGSTLENNKMSKKDIIIESATIFIASTSFFGSIIAISYLPVAITAAIEAIAI